MITGQVHVARISQKLECDKVWVKKSLWTRDNIAKNGNRICMSQFSSDFKIDGTYGILRSFSMGWPIFIEIVLKIMKVRKRVGHLGDRADHFSEFFIFQTTSIKNCSSHRKWPQNFISAIGFEIGPKLWPTDVIAGFICIISHSQWFFNFNFVTL